jgi:sugar phosphate isomerase/epimerase
VQLGTNGAGPFGRRPEEDLPGVLAIVAGVGYDGVEFHPNVASTAANAPLSPAVAQHRVSIRHLHTAPAATGVVLDLPAATRCDRLVLTAQTLLRAAAGGPWTGGAPADRFKQVAELLAGLGEAAAAAGVAVSYHPHHVDFWPLPDAAGTGLDVLLMHVPATVRVAVDLYWAHIGGVDPAAVLAWLGERADYVHVRDGRGPKTCPLGTGEVPVEPALRQLAWRDNPLAWLVSEDVTPALQTTAL